MSTLKYFYTCPLEAALMAKNHGMEFDAEIPLSCEAGYVNYVQNNTYTTLKYYQHVVQKEIYIHPDSEHILKAQMGDTVYLKNNHVGWLAENDEVEQAGDRVIGNVTRGNWKIIQRNGKAFIMPEVEEIDNPTDKT